MSDLQSKPSEAEGLIAFVANETATNEEQKFVAEVASGDAGITDELAFSRKLRTALKTQALTSPGEFGLARLKRDIAREQSAAISPTSDRWRATSFAAIAASLILAVIIVLRSPGPQEGGYQLAGSSTVVDAVHFQVTFQPDTSEAELRALLTDIDLTIVEGPSALGLYRLRANDPEVEDRALLARLRASGRVVETAELE